MHSRLFTNGFKPKEFVKFVKLDGDRAMRTGRAEDLSYAPVRISSSEPSMKRLLGPYSDFFFLLLRVVAGLMFLSHGLQKFNIQMLGGFTPPPSIPQLTWAAWIESIGAPLVIIGLASRYAAFVLSGEMAVAYFMSHAGSVLGPVQAAAGAPGPHSFFPHLNGGEITVLYCFLWLYLAARGPGKFSVDALLGIEKAQNAKVKAKVS
jgi:putative oxidoreductase